MHPESFFFADGQHAESIQDLLHVLEATDLGVTQRHVTPEKNDFALWVQHVHGNQALADKLTACGSVHEVIDALHKHLTPPKPATAPQPKAPLPKKEPLKDTSPSWESLKRDFEKTTDASKSTAKEVPKPMPKKHEPHRSTLEPEEIPSAGPIERAPRELPHIEPPRKTSHTKDFLLGLAAGICITVLVYYIGRILVG